MSQSLFYGLIAFFLYGLWGFFPKLSAASLPPQSFLLYEIVGVVLSFVVMVFFFPTPLHFDARGAFYAVCTGFFGGTGTIFYFLALKHGKLSIMSTMTGLYPVLVVILAFFILQESVSFPQGVGILLATMGILLLTLT
jgi:transporter family protein